MRASSFSESADRASGAVDDPLNSIGESLHRVARLLQRYRVEALSKQIADADPSTARLIGALIRRGPMRMTALAEVTNADISTVSRQVAGLERRGLVERQVDPADRRTSLLIPTAQAVRFDQEYVQDRSARLNEVLTDWSADDRHTLAILLVRFSDDLQTHATGPAHTVDILSSRTENTQEGMTS